jgi:hypothetical protein
VPSPNKIRAETYLTPDEYENIKDKAKNCGLSVSSFSRRMCLCHQEQNKIDPDLVMELRDMSTDLAKIGRLLKHNLDEGQIDDKYGDDLFDDIQHKIDIMEDKIIKL